MSKNASKGKLTGLVLVAIIAGAGVAGLIVAGFLFADPVVPPSFEKRVSFMEIQPAGTGDQQFFELYTWEEPGHSLEGWTVSNGTASITFPAFQNLGNMTYIAVWLGSGANQLDASGRNATFHASRSDFLGPSGELVLRDHVGRLVDHVVYGGATPTVADSNWPAGDTGLVHSGNPGMSLQMWGPDQDNSSNWIEDEITPGSENVYNFNVTTVNGDIPVALYNGINFELPTSPSEDYRFTEIVVSGNPAGWTSREDVEEMANFTLQYYADLGFPAPKLHNGKLRIHLSNSSNNYTTGSCDRLGRIRVNVGQTPGMAGNVSLKYTVEHEIMHAVQAAGGPGYDHWGGASELPISEGMAVWGGLASTMRNYNLTWNETMDYLRQSGSMNWFDHYRDLNTTVDPWPASGWTRYMAWGMFVKFLNETYGPEILVNITTGIKSHLNGSTHLDVNFTTALRNAIGITYEEAWRRFQAWLVNGTASEANGWPMITPHSSPVVPDTHGTTTTDGPVTVVPNGSDVEFINCTGKDKRFTLRFGHLDGTTRWRITIIYTRPNGTQVEDWFTIAGTVAPVPVDPTEWANITVVKTRVGNTGNGSISMNITTVAEDSVPGRHETDPRHSGVRMESPIETVAPLELMNSEDKGYVLVWLDEGWNLSITVDVDGTFLDPGDNHVQFRVWSLDPEFGLLELDPGIPPFGNPKQSVVHAPFAHYVLVEVYWPGTEPFPGPDPIPVNVMLELLFG